MLLESLFGQDVFGYDAPLLLAKKWRGSKEPAFKKQAVDLLTELSERFPLAVDVFQELALAQMDVCPERVQTTLNEARDRFANPSEEMLCRFGRLAKEQGDRLRARKEYGPARQAYNEAAQYYEDSYKIRNGQYPGINLATLHLIRAGLEQRTDFHEDAVQLMGRSESLAWAILNSRDKWYNDQLGDRDRWHPATAAEALLLLREWDRAAAIYRSIPAGWERDSMKRQVERILEAWQALGVKDFGPFNHLAEVFPDAQQAGPS